MRYSQHRASLIDRCRGRGVAVFAAVALVAFATLAVAQSQLMISQKGRQFRPGDITIKRGQSVQLVNDDADLRHHAYIDSDSLKYDSGDQEPGSKISIAFPVAGDFEVLCAIHPKMKLDVHVK
jgi:plastocyanin